LSQSTHDCNRIEDPQGQWFEGKLNTGFAKVPWTGEEEESRSGDQEDEDIDSAGEIEH
jgi:hypothetical protein